MRPENLYIQCFFKGDWGWNHAWKCLNHVFLPLNLNGFIIYCQKREGVGSGNVMSYIWSHNTRMSISAYYVRAILSVFNSYLEPSSRPFTANTEGVALIINRILVSICMGSVVVGHWFTLHSRLHYIYPAACSNECPAALYQLVSLQIALGQSKGSLPLSSSLPHVA